jgi:hypothetical protein
MFQKLAIMMTIGDDDYHNPPPPLYHIIIIITIDFRILNMDVIV